MHPNPPKKEPKYCASLITKHELMYGEHVRDVVEDTFEKGKMEIIKEAAAKNEVQPLSREDTGMSLKANTHDSVVDQKGGSTLADDYLYSVALRVDPVDTY